MRLKKATRQPQVTVTVAPLHGSGQTSWSVCR
nr:MAG TPA: hypothetical protein [Caudoviricetes sp.]